MIERDNLSACTRIYFLKNMCVERRANGEWEEATDWGNTHDARVFLAYLFCRDRLAQRSDLIEALWPHLSETEHRLSTLVSLVRKILGGAHLLEYIRNCSMFRLPAQSVVWIDVDHCFDLLKKAKKVGHTTPQGLEILREAANYFERGELLEGIDGTWRYSIQQEVYTKRRRCLHLLAEAYEAHGEYEQVEEIAEKLLRKQPEDERALSLLMIALNKQGETSEALRRYEESKQRYPDLSPAVDHLAKSLRETLRISNEINLWFPPSARGGQDMNKQRRKLLEDTASIAGALAITGIDLLSVVSPEEFLSQSRTGIKACWRLMSGKGFALVEELLTTYVPSLTRLAFSNSPYRALAASIATQAKILQSALAMHRLEFTKRELYCYEAVKCGHISGDNRLLAAALMYLAYTYTSHMYCLPRQPQKAVILFQDALHCLGKDVSIIRSDIYIGLADAYAQCGDVEKALEAIGLAKDHFPANPELDPGYLYADLDEAGVYHWEGHMYNDLAALFPEKSGQYYKNAEEAFTQSVNLQATAEKNTCATLLYRASTARGRNDLELYVSCLRTGGELALSLNSKKRYTDALEIFQGTPQKWKDEKPIQELAASIFAEKRRPSSQKY